MALYELSSKHPQSAPATVLFTSLSSAIFTGDSWKLAIPAMLYTLQNSLQYIAVSNLDAFTIQITYQLKILTTAVFSVLLLGRSLPSRRWLALLLLFIGVAVVQIPQGHEMTMTELKEGTQSNYWYPRSLDLLHRGTGTRNAGVLKRSATYQGIEEDDALHWPRFDTQMGLLASGIACITSGLAGVYFEKVLKDNKSNHSYGGSRARTSLWVRNAQLSFYSLFPALFIGVIFKDGPTVARDGFFAGYNWIVWSCIAMQALGGICVALVISYADNIAKNFATSISVLISFLGSVYFFDLNITMNVSTLSISNNPVANKSAVPCRSRCGDRSYVVV